MIAFLGITHVLIALSLYFLFLEFDLLIVISIMLDSLIPDIDIASSKLGRYNPFAPFMKHRGRTHTPLWLLIISGIIWLFGTKIMLGFTFGYFFHLVADTFTPQGIMLLYPYSEEYFSMGKRFNFRLLEPLIIGFCSVFLFVKFGQVIMYVLFGYGFLKASEMFGHKKKVWKF